MFPRGNLALWLPGHQLGKRGQGCSLDTISGSGCQPLCCVCARGLRIVWLWLAFAVKHLLRYWVTVGSAVQRSHLADSCCTCPRSAATDTTRDTAALRRPTQQLASHTATPITDLKKTCMWANKPSTQLPGPPCCQHKSPHCSSKTAKATATQHPSTTAAPQCKVQPHNLMPLWLWRTGRHTPPLNGRVRQQSRPRSPHTHSPHLAQHSNSSARDTRCLRQAGRHPAPKLW